MKELDSLRQWLTDGSGSVWPERIAEIDAASQRIAELERVLGELIAVEDRGSRGVSNSV